MKDFYEVLEVPHSSSSTAIKKAYRRLAFKWHPDRNPGNEEKSVRKYCKISEAYKVLSDEKKRKAYDQYEKEDRANDGRGRHWRHYNNQHSYKRTKKPRFYCDFNNIIFTYFSDDDEDFRDAQETSKDAYETYRDAYETFRHDDESFRDSDEAFRKAREKCWSGLQGAHRHAGFGDWFRNEPFGDSFRSEPFGCHFRSQPFRDYYRSEPFPDFFSPPDAYTAKYWSKYYQPAWSWTGNSTINCNGNNISFTWNGQYYAYIAPNGSGEITVNVDDERATISWATFENGKKIVTNTVIEDGKETVTVYADGVLRTKTVSDVSQAKGYQHWSY